MPYAARPIFWLNSLVHLQHLSACIFCELLQCDDLEDFIWQTLFDKVDICKPVSLNEVMLVLQNFFFMNFVGMIWGLLLGLFSCAKSMCYFFEIFTWQLHKCPHFLDEFQNIKILVLGCGIESLWTLEWSYFWTTQLLVLIQFVQFSKFFVAQITNMGFQLQMCNILIQNLFHKYYMCAAWYVDL